MLRSAAETMALNAIAWAASEGALAPFLAESGLAIEDFRRRAGEAELLAAFLDFLLARDALAGAFCEAQEIDPQILHQARRALPGAPPDG
jgi:hypothetical protein